MDAAKYTQWRSCDHTRGSAYLKEAVLVPAEKAAQHRVAAILGLGAGGEDKPDVGREGGGEPGHPQSPILGGEKVNGVEEDANGTCGGGLVEEAGEVVHYATIVRRDIQRVFFEYYRQLHLRTD